MENINELLEKYNKINESIKNEEDTKIKEQLQTALSSITLMIQDELKKEQQRGNTSEEFIQLCSRFDAITTIEKEDKEDKYRNNEIGKVINQDKNYTLASNKIISSYDGSEIDISNLSRIEKIKAIYEYTGVEINNKDPEVLKLCDLRFQEFLRGCDPSTYEQKYGYNWQQKVEQIYKSNYLSTVQRCIANGLNEVDEKNRLQEKSLSEQLEQSEKEIEKLNTEVSELKEEVVELTGTVQKIQAERKEELEQYKKIMTAMVKNNSEDERRLYQDGTTRPDMNWDEYGRYTTRRDRKDETGMQRRINDVAHVHQELTDSEKKDLQLEYEHTFGALPMHYDEPTNMNYNEYGRYTTYKADRANESKVMEIVNDTTHIHDESTPMEHEKKRQELEIAWNGYATEEDKPKSR